MSSRAGDDHRQSAEEDAECCAFLGVRVVSKPAGNDSCRQHVSPDNGRADRSEVTAQKHAKVEELDFVLAVAIALEPPQAVQVLELRENAPLIEEGHQPLHDLMADGFVHHAESQG